MSLAAVVFAAAAAAERAPVFGIVPTNDLDNGYVPWVEQWGATVKILPRYSSPSTQKLETIFQSINALLLPGVSMGANGGSLESALLQRALQANAAGDYFPVWGTCKGMETLMTTIGGSRALQSGFDSVDYPTALTLTAASPGRMLAGANASLVGWVQSEPITYNNHGAGATPEHFAANGKLNDFFNVLAVSADREGKKMVELIEGRTAPIYGAQFHNEKPQFVPATGQTKHIPKTPQAQAFAAYMASFLVDEARKNNHTAQVETSE